MGRRAHTQTRTSLNMRVGVSRISRGRDLADAVPASDSGPGSRATARVTLTVAS